MRDVSDKRCRENNNIDFTLNNSFFFLSFENGVVYDKTCKNMVKPQRSRVTIRCMRLARWITKASHTNSEYVTLIAFLRQKLLCERVTILR